MKIPTRTSKMDKMLDPFELDILESSKKAESINGITHILCYKSDGSIPVGFFDYDPGNSCISKNGELIKRIRKRDIIELLEKKWLAIFTHEKTMEQRRAEIQRKITERTDD